MSPTYPAFGSDGLLIGVAGTDFVVDKLDEALRTLVLQDFSRRSRGTLQAPADVPMTCFYQNTTANVVCPGSTPPGSAAVCPRTDTSSSLAQLTCCGTCGSGDDAKDNGPSNVAKKAGISIRVAVGVAVPAGLLIWWICRKCRADWPPSPPPPSPRCRDSSD